jgi:RNA-directed DNA polymerase
MGLLR